MKNHEQGIFLALSWVRTNRYDQRVLCNKMDRTKSPTLFELVFHLDFFWTTLGQTYRYDASLATDTNDVADDIPPWWSSSTSFRIVIHEPIKRRTETTSTKTLLLKQVEIIADSGKDSSVPGKKKSFTSETM